MIFQDETVRAQQLESFQDVIPVAVLYCQPIFQNDQVADFRYIWGNHAALTMSALTPGEIGQRTMLQVFPSFVDTGVFSRYVQAWETGITQRFERPHPIGSHINWVDVTVSKKYEGIIITSLDITASKQAQLALEQQTQLLKTIVEHLPAGLTLFHPVRNEAGNVTDFRYVLTNPVNARTVGLSVEQLINRSVLDIFPSAREQGSLGRLVEVLQTGIPKHYETHYQADGLDLWVEGHLTRIGDGVLLTYLDNTPLQKQQQALREQADLLHQKNEQLHQINQALTRTNQRLQGFQAIERALLNQSLTEQGPEAAALLHIRELVPCEQLVVFRFNHATGLAQAESWLVGNERATRTASGLPSHLFHVEPLLSGQSWLLDHLQPDSVGIPPELNLYKRGFRSLLVIPLFSQQQYIGAFVLLSHTPRFFTEEYRQIAGEVASQLAIVIYQQHLNEQLQQHTEQLEQRVAERTREIGQLLALQNAILKNAGQAIISTDTQGVVLTANPAVEQVSGYRADELIGRHPRTRFDVSEAPVPILTYQAELPSAPPTFLIQPILQEQGFFQTECLIEGKGGKRFPVLLTTSTLQNEEGEITGYVGMATDISLLKAAEEKLKQKNRELNTFFVGALDMHCISDSQGNISKINQAFQVALGYTEAELMAIPFLHLLHPDEQKFVFQNLLTGILHRPVRNQINRFRKKDGTYRIIEWNAIGIDNLVYGSARDITQRKLAEDALRESEQRFREIAENVDEVFWIHAVEPFKLLYINPAYERVFGIVRQQVPGNEHSFLDTILEEDRAATLAEFEKYRQGQEVTVQCRVKGTHQAIRWLLIRTFVMKDSQGVPVRYIGIANDITSQKEKELVLQQSLAREQELSKLKSQVVSTASHEFRTPLATIQTSVDLIRLYLEQPPETARPAIKNYLGVIQQQVQNYTGLLSDMLTIGKIESGKVAFNPRWVDVLALCQQIIGSHFSHQPDGRTVRVSLVGPSSRAYLDEKLMTHVLVNLLSNAFKFSKTNPGLAIRFEKQTLVIEVTDEGIGIPATELSSLFQTFFRASNTASIQGTGLGLVIARQFVELHGGTLTVESQETQGSTFTIRLPIEPDSHSIPSA
ncbi:PAS domain S-box protein [Larkinella humicola]|nr:PAS domain S-box protein [Larkinella humicola]